MYFKGCVSNVIVFVLFLRFVSTVTGIGGVEVPQVSTVTGTVGVRVAILVPVVAFRPSTLLELLFFLEHRLARAVLLGVSKGVENFGKKNNETYENDEKS